MSVTKKKKKDQTQNSIFIFAFSYTKTIFQQTEGAEFQLEEVEV